jgi:acyl-CoA reductase-like NAD-dependent aldehyde dehydrogenase
MIDRKNFYINGQWVNPKSKEEIKVVNPATEQDCAVIALANKHDVNDAVVAAKNAYDTWAFTSKEERIQLLEKLYESYKKDGMILLKQSQWKWELLKIFQQNYKQVLVLHTLNHL